MLLFEFVRWWYGAGLATRFRDQLDALVKLADSFSIKLAFKHFFAPFKQIDNVDASGPVSFDVRIQFLIGRLVSRVIGAFMRTFLIIAGAIALSFRLALAAIFVVLHLILPIAPVFGVFFLSLELIFDLNFNFQGIINLVTERFRG